ERVITQLGDILGERLLPPGVSQDDLCCQSARAIGLELIQHGTRDLKDCLQPGYSINCPKRLVELDRNIRSERLKIVFPRTEVVRGKATAVAGTLSDIG